MTGHELARLLLSLPDLTVIASDDCVEVEIVGAYVEDDATWQDPRQWTGGRAVVLENAWSLKPLPPVENDGKRPLKD